MPGRREKIMKLRGSNKMKQNEKNNKKKKKKTKKNKNMNNIKIQEYKEEDKE